MLLKGSVKGRAVLAAPHATSPACLIGVLGRRHASLRGSAASLPPRSDSSGFAARFARAKPVFCLVARPTRAKAGILAANGWRLAGGAGRLPDVPGCPFHAACGPNSATT